MPRPISTAAATLALALLAAGPAGAWSREGHMLSAAIAYDDLMAKDPATASAIANIIDHHPDRGTFQVATEGASADGRTLRLMMECARWPDDTRNTPFDHPTWHYAETATAGAGAPTPLPVAVSGEAIEALRLSVSEASDPQAPIADRALALCWVMHLAGDLQQPLHASTLFSSAYPQGDAGGSQQFVIDPDSGEKENLHWFWDKRANTNADAKGIGTLAAKLEKRFTRAGLTEMAQPSDFAQWAAESHALAAANAYPPALVTGATIDKATNLPAGYADMAAGIAARRITLAGYRIADLLKAIVSAAPPPKDVK